MVRILLKLVIIVLVPAMLYGSYKYGQVIPFSEQWPLFEALRTTASIIFAVVGAWIAIIYPERLKFTFKADSSTSSRSAGASVNMGKLLHPAIHSTMILCIVLAVGVIAPLMKHFPLFLPYISTMRGLSYGLLVFLTFWQVWTVILTLIPADMIKTKSDLDNRKKETTSRFFSQTTKHEGKKTGDKP